MSALRSLVDLFAADLAALERRYDLMGSPARVSRLRAFYREWLGRLSEISFAGLDREGQTDALLLGRRLRRDLQALDRAERSTAEIATLVPFRDSIAALHEARRRMETPDPSAAAATLAEIAATVARLQEPLGPRPSALSPQPLAERAGAATEELRQALKGWHEFYSGYDPRFTWWTAHPYSAAADALDSYDKALRERAGDSPAALGAGEPLGAAGLAAELDAEWIGNSPEELLAMADREAAWCVQELRAAARDLGCGEDWRAALERVKELHEEPGGQPDLVRDLALEAIAFVEERDLVTVPPLAKEVWRIEMMPPEKQRINPFFLGGETIQVSFPTDGMTHDEKRMSLRGNNRHFARATVQHELIPGHHLQGFAMERHHPHRRHFSTPFWIEGWTLHWEMLLWELGFPRGPEDRIGMLFWRLHRAARVQFSFRFHLGEMTPAECVELLVERVGHERANAEAEVRRSFSGSYPPLYQAAYLLGGLQVHALYREATGSAGMTASAFHDAFLVGGPMPISLARARLLGLPLDAQAPPVWRF